MVETSAFDPRTPTAETMVYSRDHLRRRSASPIWVYLLRYKNTLKIKPQICINNIASLLKHFPEATKSLLKNQNQACH